MKIQFNNLSKNQVVILVSLVWAVILCIAFFLVRKKDTSFDAIQEVRNELSSYYEHKLDSIVAEKDKKIAKLDMELAKVSSDNQKLYDDFIAKKDSFEKKIYWLKQINKHEVINYSDSTLNSIVRKLSD